MVQTCQYRVIFPGRAYDGISRRPTTGLIMGLDAAKRRQKLKRFCQLLSSDPDRDRAIVVGRNIQARSNIDIN